MHFPSTVFCFYTRQFADFFYDFLERKQDIAHLPPGGQTQLSASTCVGQSDHPWLIPEALTLPADGNSEKAVPAQAEAPCGGFLSIC